MECSSIADVCLDCLYFATSAARDEVNVDNTDDVVRVLRIAGFQTMLLSALLFTAYKVQDK